MQLNTLIVLTLIQAITSKNIKPRAPRYSRPNYYTPEMEGCVEMFGPLLQTTIQQATGCKSMDCPPTNDGLQIVENSVDPTDIAQLFEQLNNFKSELTNLKENMNFDPTSLPPSLTENPLLEQFSNLELGNGDDNAIEDQFLSQLTNPANENGEMDITSDQTGLLSGLLGTDGDQGLLSTLIQPTDSTQLGLGGEIDALVGEKGNSGLLGGLLGDSGLLGGILGRGGLLGGLLGGGNGGLLGGILGGGGNGGLLGGLLGGGNGGLLGGLLGGGNGGLLGGLLGGGGGNGGGLLGGLLRRSELTNLPPNQQPTKQKPKPKAQLTKPQIQQIQKLNNLVVKARATAKPKKFKTIKMKVNNLGRASVKLLKDDKLMLKLKANRKGRSTRQRNLTLVGPKKGFRFGKDGKIDIDTNYFYMAKLA